MSEETKDDAKEKGIPRYTGQSPKPDTRPRLKAPEPPKPAKEKKAKPTPSTTIPAEPAPQLSPEEIRAKRLEALATQHSIAIATITPTQLVRDIYEVCKFMQRVKPYNADLSSIETLSKAESLDLKTYWMQHTDELAKAVTDGIIFFATGGNKRSKYDSDYYGWGLRKNPIVKSEKIGKEVWEWERCWLENYGYLNPDIAEEIKVRQAAIEEANKRVVTRRHNYVWLENKSTFQIAQMWAVANLMGSWMWHQRMATWFEFDKSGDIIAWLNSIWMEQARIMELELEYRTEAEPQPRSSKKKTEAAKEDFRRAFLILAGRVTGLYSEDFIKMVEATEFPFDLSLDPEALPKQRPEKQPVMRMGYSQLIAEFTRFVTNGEINPDSFEGEDAIALKRRVREAVEQALEDERKALARAKGQKVETTGVGDENP